MFLLWLIRKKGWQALNAFVVFLSVTSAIIAVNVIIYLLGLWTPDWIFERFPEKGDDPRELAIYARGLVICCILLSIFGFTGAVLLALRNMFQELHKEYEEDRRMEKVGGPEEPILA